ncbi:MAG: hypothetical protein KatS3mg035_0502 [Bacteroidia bacterium]|nr:MAG: hypothetical protein KatS3mg035_0502 [Bacteroidia bacterium]
MCVTHAGTPPPNCLANDLCTSPTPITFTLGNVSCVNGCTNGTTPGPDFMGNNCYDFPNGTVWYSLTTPANAATLDITLSSPTMLNPYFTVFTTSDCNNFSIINCTRGSTNNASFYNINVAPNTTYLIAVSNDGTVEGDFELCVNVQVDNSACNVDNSLVVTATSMGSPFTGPFKPGEIVTFCYTINQFIQTNCNYLQGIVPTFGDCWDPTFLSVQGEPPVTVPLQTAGTITTGLCAGLPAGTWQWFPAGSVIYNNIGGPMANQPLPGGWYFRNITGPLAFGCVAPADPDDAWGDSNSGCGNNSHTWQVCFQLRAKDITACNSGNTDCSVSIKTYADGEIGVWNNIGCTVDIPNIFPSNLCCTPPPTVSGTTICTNNSATLTPSAPAGVTFVWYNVPTGGTPIFTGASFTTPVLTSTTTYYVESASPGCTSARTAVTVTVQPLPNAGTNGSLTICSGSTVTAAQLFAALGGNPDAGGTWSPAPGGAGTYTYTVNATAPCTGTATAQVVVTEQPLPNAGTNGSLTICSGSTVTAAQLFAALGGNPDAGGTWSPAPGGAGTYTYTVNATAPCTGTATAQVVVTESSTPNAGTNGSLTICSGSTVTAAQLFAALGVILMLGARGLLLLVVRVRIRIR